MSNSSNQNISVGKDPINTDIYIPTKDRINEDKKSISRPTNSNYILKKHLIHIQANNNMKDFIESHKKI